MQYNVPKLMVKLHIPKGKSYSLKGKISVLLNHVSHKHCASKVAARLSTSSPLYLNGTIRHRIIQWGMISAMRISNQEGTHPTSKATIMMLYLICRHEEIYASTASHLLCNCQAIQESSSSHNGNRWVTGAMFMTRSLPAVAACNY